MLTHTRTFRVRLYECDAYGHVNNANYLRYMQETAFDASALAGYDFARYDTLGKYFLVRETDVEYLRPLRYGDSVDVKTWVVDFRRTRSRRAYEFRPSGDDELAARATSDWVFLDRASGKPTAIPQELVHAFFPDVGAGSPRPSAPPREKFPSAPPPPPGVFKTRRRVAWQDIDTEEHVNNAVYLAYAEDAGIQISLAYDWPLKRMKQEGFGIIARRHQIQYCEPAILDDELEIATWVSNVKRATATRHYTITRLRDNTLLTRIHTLYVWVDLATGRPIRLPPHFLAHFAPNIVE